MRARLHQLLLQEMSGKQRYVWYTNALLVVLFSLALLANAVDTAFVSGTFR